LLGRDCFFKSRSGSWFKNTMEIFWRGGCFVEFFEAKFNTLVQQ
jgi:hypothetical protein